MFTFVHNEHVIITSDKSNLDRLNDFRMYIKSLENRFTELVELCIKNELTKQL
jgi:hypothetical protein